jgi:hypothetical protein
MPNSDVDYWSLRAEQARALVPDNISEKSRQCVIQIANLFEQLAVEAESKDPALAPSV